MKRMLVLYRELAGYFVTCMKHLAEQHDVEIDIVAYPINADAPFQFDFGSRISVYKRTTMHAAEIEKLVSHRNYHLIFCGGWTDADYLDIVRNHREIPSLVGFDKQWLGSSRDWISAMKNRLRVKPIFDFAFVPGVEQKHFAKKMGFHDHEIMDGAYSCDTQAFGEVYVKRQAQHADAVKRLWFAGRYVTDKGIDLLCEVFAELHDSEFPQWQLHAVGTGELEGKLGAHPAIVHHGFQQPSAMKELMVCGDLFVLPSLYEPWGVVVHEFAMAGFPLLVSDKVGARTAFVEPGANGEIFAAGRRDALRMALKRWMSKNHEELIKAGEYSHQLALRISPEKYALSILSMMKVNDEGQ
jgi:glycosyltransferase involved in cell wall biosynthesis